MSNSPSATCRRCSDPPKAIYGCGRRWSGRVERSRDREGAVVRVSGPTAPLRSRLRYAVIADQVELGWRMTQRPEEAGDLSAMMRAVIDHVQHDFPELGRVGIALHVLVVNVARWLVEESEP